MTDRQERLAALLGDRLPSAWRGAFMAMPRHLFVPDRAERVADGGGQLSPIDRLRDPEGWLDAVYSDDIIVTQADGRGVATSSCSMPYMVFAMLDHLDVRDGDRVCEIGTGTGWNAALLSARLGDDRVVTIEVDPDLADRARANLTQAGHAPKVVTGDGVFGWASGAPFDRMIATCAVNVVPYVWIEQTAVGGVVVVPWGTPLHNGALLRLVVGPDGDAEGRFVDSAAFMWLRAQYLHVPDEPDDFPDTATRTTTAVDVADVFDGGAMFAVGLLVGGCRLGFDRADDGTVTTCWLLAADSWASVSPGSGAVYQLGVRRLWDEVEAAYGWWADHGRPESTRFGMTVGPVVQSVWLDDPDQTIVATETGGRIDGRTVVENVEATDVSDGA